MAKRVRSGTSLPPAVTTGAVGLRVGDASIAWSEVIRVDAYKRDAYVGDLLCVTILGQCGRIIEINEASPCWSEAGAAIESFLPGSVPHVEWMLRLIGSDVGQPVAIYPLQRCAARARFSR